MEVSSYYSPNTMGNVYECHVGKDEIATKLGDLIYLQVVEFVSRQIANDILANNYNEIMAKISPEVIANMAIAEAGAAVNETLHKKMPDKILEIEKVSTQVYQRGLLGGMTRIK